MARRQAAPKPEELIAKLEERLDTFRDDVTARLDLQLRHKQNMSDGKAVSILRPAINYSKRRLHKFSVDHQMN